MLEQEILEGNKLIAEFMGYKSCFSHIEDKYGYTQTVDGYLITGKCNIGNHQEDEYENFDIKSLKFHSSWDWLMPIIIRIEQMGYFVIIHNENCLIGNKNYKQSRENRDRVVDVNSITKLDACYESIVIFIKWYNKNNF